MQSGISYYLLRIKLLWNIVLQNTQIDISEDVRYYAWSKSSPTHLVATFVAWTWVNSISEWDATAICAPEVRYNEEENATTCKVTFPSVVEKVWYHDPRWYIHWMNKLH